jgi:hypothetical protein
VAIWHAVEGDWQPPLSGPRDRFESTGTRVFRAANGSLSALPQGVSAGRDNWRLEAPEEVVRPAFFWSGAYPTTPTVAVGTMSRTRSRSCASVLTRVPFCSARERRARPVRRIQSELEREFPRTPAENGVTEEPDLQRVYPRDAFARRRPQQAHPSSRPRGERPGWSHTARGAARVARALPRPLPPRPRGGASHRCR